MSEEMQKPSLSLVSSFYEADYPYPHRTNLTYIYDSQERYCVMQGYRAAIHVTNIDDYKLLETQNSVTLYLKTPAEYERIIVALDNDTDILGEFIQTEPTYDIRKLKRHKTQLQKIADSAGFRESIAFDIQKTDRRILIHSTNKKDYFDFADFVTQNGMLEKYAKLQRKEPEFNL